MGRTSALRRREIHIASAVKREHGLRCPRCGGAADGSTAVTGCRLDKPPEMERGQLVICLYCCAVNIYDKPLLRTLDRTERREVLRRITPEARSLFELTMKAAARK